MLEIPKRCKSPFDYLNLSSEELKYLELLSQKFPNKKEAKVEIVNLNAILELPRGTEHFVSDVHGEFEAFIHVLRNSSGLVRQIIRDNKTLSLLGPQQEDELATLIYYPKERIRYQKSIFTKREELDHWYKIQIRRIIIVLKGITYKYTRSKVGKYLKKLPYGYIIQEMLTERIQGTSHLQAMVDKYFDSIVDNLIKERAGKEVIIEMSNVIQNLGVEQLHILGDIYDRGPGAEVIMDYLINETNMLVDFTFGNHDVVWIGAASGCPACLASVIRIQIRYSNMETLEEGYGISLNPLREFTKSVYGDTPHSKYFNVKNAPAEHKKLLCQMEKAMFIIQAKLEAQIIRKHPEFEMNDRLLLERINFEKNTVLIRHDDGSEVEYAMNDMNFPTIDPKNPEKLTKAECELVTYFLQAFEKSQKLHKHMRFLFGKGNMYTVQNNNIMFHACIPITKNFEFKEVQVGNDMLSGKELMDYLYLALQKEYTRSVKKSGNGNVVMSVAYWMWCGKNSPLFLKSKMATFERYFIDDKKSWVENKGAYYKLRDDQRLVNLLFEEFGVDPKRGHVIVGHVPVIEKKGELPIRCNGKYITIDGGFSKAYQSVTGIAGYTLRADSQGYYLYVHKSFTSTQDAVENFSDLHSEMRQIEKHEMRVKDTDVGNNLLSQIKDCRNLILAYKKKLIRQQKIETKVIKY